MAVPASNVYDTFTTPEGVLCVVDPLKVNNARRRDFDIDEVRLIGENEPTLQILETVVPKFYQRMMGNNKQELTIEYTLEKEDLDDRETVTSIRRAAWEIKVNLTNTKLKVQQLTRRKAAKDEHTAQNRALKKATNVVMRGLQKTSQQRTTSANTFKNITTNFTQRILDSVTSHQPQPQLLENTSTDLPVMTKKFIDVMKHFHTPNSERLLDVLKCIPEAKAYLHLLHGQSSPLVVANVIMHTFNMGCTNALLFAIEEQAKFVCDLARKQLEQLYNDVASAEKPQEHYPEILNRFYLILNTRIEQTKDNGMLLQ